jgi:hypothetical protein
MAKSTLEIELDASKLIEALDNLPDEILDRLADKLAPRVEHRLVQRARLAGR